jgi:hypothetical protein
MGASNSSGYSKTNSNIKPSCNNGQCGGAKKRKSGSSKRKLTKRKITKRKITKKKSSKKVKKLIKHGNHSHRTMKTLHSCKKKY